VSSAAENARKEAEEKAKEVSMRREEVDLAQKQSDLEKAKMEESFAQMSVGLQEEVKCKHTHTPIVIPPQTLFTHVCYDARPF
jgi:hypothetical protein